MRSFGRALVVSILLVGVVVPSVSLAAPLSNPIVPQTCNKAGGCSSICDLATLAQNLLNAGIFIVVFLSAVLFAYAGFKMATAYSRGVPGDIAAARKIFWNVIIGLVIILAAWGIVNVLMKTLTGNSNWSRLCGYSAAQVSPLAAR